MEEWLHLKFYGNELITWLKSTGIVVLSVLTARIVFQLIDRYALKIALKTKTKIDDILLKAIESPLVIGIVLAGFWYAIQILHTVPRFDALLKHSFYFLIAMNITWLLARLFNGIVDKYLIPLVANSQSQTDDLLMPFVRKVTNIVIWAMGVVIALNNAGYDVGAILAGLGLGGLAVAMAAKDTVANLIGALMILIDRPFVVGDNVIVKGYNAVVCEIGMRNTTFDIKYAKQMLIVPNSDIINTPIINVSREPSRMYEIVLILKITTCEQKVKQALLLVDQAVLAHQYTEKKVMTWFVLTSKGIEITSRFWVMHECKETCFDYAQVRSEVLLEVIKTFRENELQLAYLFDDFVANLKN